MSQSVQRLGRDVRVREPAQPTSQGTDLRLMREANRLLVLNCVRASGALTRAEVARRTRLSRTTVSNIVDVLLSEGFVREGDSQRADGKRSIPVRFNAQAGYVIGIAMGRNHLTVVLCDLAATMLRRDDVPFATERGPTVCLPELASVARAFVAEQRIPWGRVVGVGVGMPGPLDATLQGSARAPRMPGWDGVPVRDPLAAALGKPVYLDNNAHMGALGESHYGVGRDAQILLYVKLGTGIGSGLVIGGHIYRGGSGSAGEIGHMTVDPTGPLCDCGNRGCLETIAGAPAIVALARGAGATADATSSVAALAQAAQAGDPACQQALTQAGEAIGVALAGLLNALNPTLIVMDGSVFHAAGAGLFAPIRQTIERRSLPAPLAHARIVPAALVGASIALGGVATVLDEAFNPAPTENAARPTPIGAL